jgi:dihydrofolate reductase
MSKLIYVTNTSLDGYVEDEAGSFGWVNPDQVHAFITELLRPIGTHLYGRRLYETMAYWDAPVEGYPPNTATSHRSGRRAKRSSFHER